MADVLIGIVTVSDRASSGVYNDVSGYATIGVGHKLLPGESFSDGITHDQAIDLLRKDVCVAEHAIDTHVKVALTQNAYDALSSFIFNCGLGAFASSTLLKLLNAGDNKGAADQFLVWCKATIGGKIVTNAGILARRARERMLFLMPDVPQPVVPEGDGSQCIGTAEPIEILQKGS